MRRILIPILPCLLAAQPTPEPARIQAFQATAKAVRRGAPVTLRWSVTGADQVRLDPIGLILPAKGEITHMVAGRTVYWLHVANASGGQSAPLVIEVMPEEGLPPQPQPPLLAPVLPVDLPKLADLPAFPVLQARPVQATGAVATRRDLRRKGSRQVWIQYAALVSPRMVLRLQRSLQKVAATESTVQGHARRSGRPYHLVRSGPYGSVLEARTRLHAMAPALQRLNLRPIVILGPFQGLGPAPVYLADSRRPE